MIRLLLMALGAYTLYRMYAPIEPDGPRERLSDLRSDAQAGQRRARVAGDFP